MSGLVKICGIRRVDHAVATAEAGADLIGFNFAASKRYVEPDIAREAIDAVRAINPAIRTVGLFLYATRDEIRRVHEVAGFDLVQLHGDLSIDEIAGIGLPAIVPVRVQPNEDIERLHAFVSQAAASDSVEFVMIDGYHPELAGGTGLRADWGVARVLAETVSLMLAGGLNPENVADAIASVRPEVVDVSSGVERDGVKDPDLIRAFIRNARSAFAQSISSGTSSQDAP